MSRKFPRMVKRLREERGFTQRELARRVGLDVGYYCRAENGRVPISNEAVLRIADVLRVSPTELLAAAEKLRYRFPYDSVSDGARSAFRKLADGEYLSRDEQDSVHHVVRAWELRVFGYQLGEEAGGSWRRVNGVGDGEQGGCRYERAFWSNAARLHRSPLARQEEVEAVGILQEFRDRYRADGGLRVPVREIARDMFHLGCRVGDLSYLGPGVFGVLMPREGEVWTSGRIAEDGCARFTIAHELYHLLHWWADSALNTEEPKGVRGRSETRANRFAASLLMPQASLRRVVNRWQLKDPDYRYALAVAHGVSVQAIEWRLVSLGLIRVRTLAQTYKPVIARKRHFRPDRFPSLTLQIGETMVVDYV